MPVSENNIEIRSEEVQEILSHVPQKLIMWGSTVILSVIVLVLVSTWFIKYPDVVNSQVVLVTEPPPVHLVARSEGRIDLSVEDKQPVKEGMILGIIENPARLEDMLAVIDQMKEIKDNVYNHPEELYSGRLRAGFDLGNTQSSYLAFVAVIEEAKRFREISFHENQQQALAKRIAYYIDLNEKYSKQEKILQEEIEISKGAYYADSTLLAQAAISKIEANKSRANYLQNKRSLENIEGSSIQNEILVAQLTGEISALRLKKMEENDRLHAVIIDAYEKLEGELLLWKQNYLLISPINGKVSFSKFWSDNQFVKLSEEVLSILPESENIIGKVEMPVAGSGKVEIGQRVNIKFDNYPSAEYGMILGRIESISLMPRNDKYNIRISLPNGLTSTYGKELHFQQEMHGIAKIVTKDKRLIERILNPLRNSMDSMK